MAEKKHGITKGTTSNRERDMRRNIISKVIQDHQYSHITERDFISFCKKEISSYNNNRGEDQPEVKIPTDKTLLRNFEEMGYSKDELKSMSLIEKNEFIELYKMIHDFIKEIRLQCDNKHLILKSTGIPDGTSIYEYNKNRSEDFFKNKSVKKNTWIHLYIILKKMDTKKSYVILFKRNIRKRKVLGCIC